MYQALYRKWRPKLFDDVVGQTHITETLKRQISAGRTSHAYLFTGTRGTGKTTCAKILAKAVNCEHPVEGNPCGHCAACVGIEEGSILDVVELDAASNNGVDQVRALRDEAVYAPAAVKKRVYIIDEVHMLTIPAFNALLKILEEPPAHLMFILATTELHKVPATILSRCQRFSFKRIQNADIAQRLTYIAGCEQIDLTPDGAALLARLADGGLRDALSLLDQCAISGHRVDQDHVLDTLGLAGNLKTAHIMNDICNGNVSAALNAFSELYASGKDVSAVLDELSALARDLLVRKTAPESSGLMAGGYDEATLKTLESGFTAQRLLYLLTVLQETLANLKNSANRRTDAELCIIKLCDHRLEDSPLALSARIARLEAALASGATLTSTALTPVPSSSAQGSSEAPQPAGVAIPSPEPQTIPYSEPAVAPIIEPVAPVAPPLAQEVASSEPPVASSPIPVAAAGDQFWRDLVPDLKEAVSMAVYPFLSNEASCIGSLYGNKLTIYLRDEFSRRRINQPKVLESIAAFASARAGAKIQVALSLGMPNADANSTPTPAPGSGRRGAKQRHGAPPAPPVVSQPAPPPQTAAPVDRMDELVAYANGKGNGIVTVTE